jgi:RecA-family ATPase
MDNKTPFSSNTNVQSIEFTREGARQNENRLPVLTEEITRVSSWLTEKPPEPEVLIYLDNNNFLTKGTVGALVAAGGTGKTYFMLILSYMLSAGKNFGPLNSKRPLKILILTAEDPKEQIAIRLWNIGQGTFPGKLHISSIYGKVGPLMGFEGNKVVRTETYEWFIETIRRHPNVDLVIIDTKSRLYGLDENNNDHATQWITGLEAACDKCNCTILFTHHVAKSHSNNLTQTMSRGASAIVDGCRFVAGLSEMNKDTAQKLNIVDHKNYIVFDVVKSNYAAKLKSKLYFRRLNYGLLEYVDPKNDNLQQMANSLRNILKSGKYRVSKSDLIYKQEGKFISDKINELFIGYKRNSDMRNIIEYAIEQNFIFEKKDRLNLTGKPKLVLHST